MYADIELVVCIRYLVLISVTNQSNIAFRNGSYKTYYPHYTEYLVTLFSIIKANLKHKI